VTDARPPGWYDEPSGNRALLRWWDGRSWTPVTRERAPFEAPPDPPGPAGPVGGDVLDSATAGRPAPRRGVLLGLLAAAVVVLIAVVGLPGGGSGERLADGGPGPDRTSLATPPEPAPTTPRPVSGRVVDRVARLSYDVLPGDWREWDRDSFSGLLSTLGYYRITQQNAPNNQTYWANVNSGPVDERTTGPDLPSTARRLASTLAEEYYPPHTRQQLAQRALTVDGADAYLVRYRAVFDPDRAEGYAAKSEEVAVLVVDTGQPVPSALYVSLPDTVRPLWPSIDGLLSSVRVVR